MRALRGVCRLAPLLALGLAVRAAIARADSLSLRWVPSYSWVASSGTDAAGVTTKTETQQVPQRFTLDVNKSLYPALTWGASGLLDWNKTWTRDDATGWTNGDSRRWAGNTRLELAAETLRSTLGYSRVQTEAETTQAAVTTHGDGPVGENYFLSLVWRPADLPTANLSLSRQDTYDAARTQLDRTSNNASVGLDYDGFAKWQLHYAYQLTNPIDHLRDNETVSHTQAARVGWGDQYADNRLSTFASYAVGSMSSRTRSGALGAVRETQRLPSAGLSRVEAFPDVPARDTLQPNPALVDSVLTGGAGIDLGRGRTIAGDTAYRDLGAQFPEDRLDLNTVLVFVDRPLTDPVVHAFTWEAWVSDDNYTWTALPIVGSPVFAILQNRFEITIERTKARYVKVVTRPLPVAVTTDPLYSEILVTEVQFSLVEPLPPGITRSSDLSGTFTGGLRYVMLRDRNLSYDAAFTLAHRQHPLQARESLQQSVAFFRNVNPRTQFSARVARTDSLEQSQRYSANTWGAALNGQPVTGLTWNLNYGGGFNSSPSGDELNSGINAGVGAALYDGVSSDANVGYRYSEARGRQVQSATAATGLTVTPHRTLTATGTFNWAYDNTLRGTGAQDRRSGRIDGSVAFNPFPAFYVAATAGRYVFGMNPAVQTSVNAGLSIFQGGGLSLRFGYGQTSEALTETSGRSLNAGLSWNIARGRSLSVTFNHLESRSPVLRYDVDSVFASLQLPAF